MAKIVYEPGDVFRKEDGKIGIVLNDTFVLVVEKSDENGPHTTGESYPSVMNLVPEEEVKKLNFETQCVIIGVRSTLAVFGHR